MTNDEIYDMMIECVKAAKDKKKMQYYSDFSNCWMDIDFAPITDIVINIAYGTKYRVKLEPKTVRTRMYWAKLDGQCQLRHAIVEEIDSDLAFFHDWAGDEQILTVPEV